MSFIRIGEQDSDVYVYPGSYADGREYFMCCEPLDTKDELRRHLLDHLAKGDCVPERAFDEMDAWDSDVVALLSEWADAGRGKEFANYQEAWAAATAEMARIKDGTVGRARPIAENLGAVYSDKRPPHVQLLLGDNPPEGDL